MFYILICNKFKIRTSFVTLDSKQPQILSAKGRHQLTSSTIYYRQLKNVSEPKFK